MARRGRPSVSRHEPSMKMTLVLPLSVYDRLYAMTSQGRVKNVPEMIRRVLYREIRNTKSENAST